MQQIKVSVIIPAYNAEDYIDTCLNSMREQTEENIEIIVVDDGSTDSTLDLSHKHSDEDNRITILEQENCFAGVARNKGMEIARGKYLLFFDADDFCEPTLIEDMFDRAEHTSADVVICRSRYFNDITKETLPITAGIRFVDLDEVYSGATLHDRSFQFCIGWSWDKLFRSEFVQKTGLQFQNLRTTNDAFFVYMSVVLAEKIAFVDKELVLHRTENASSLENTRKESWDNIKHAVLAIEKALKDKSLYESFSQSFLNWVLYMQTWNIETLPEQSAQTLVEWMKEYTIAQLPNTEEYIKGPEEQLVVSLLTGSSANMIKHVLMTKRQSDGRIAELEEISRFKAAHISELENSLALSKDNLARIQTELEELNTRHQATLGSTSYKVGKVIMKLPCAVKDALKKGD